MTSSIGRFTSEKARESYDQACRALESLWPLASEEVAVETGFGTTHVRISGEGDRLPLVLLHGLNGSGLSWHGVVQELASDRVVYAPDVVGTAGRSVQTAPLVQPTDYGRWGEQLLDGLGLERAHVLGYSEGAWFASLLAGRVPQRLASLTLGEGITTLVKPSQAVLMRMIAASMWPTTRSFERLDAWLTPGVTVTEEEQTLARAAMRYRRRAPWPSPLTDAQLAAITVPTLAFFGAESRIGDVETAAARVRENVPHAEVELIPGGGHSALWQMPDRVLPIIRRFQRTHDAA